MTEARRRLLLAAALTVAWTAALAALLHDEVVNYFPVGDQWALLAASHPTFADPAAWFTRGFADYFTFYSGLSVPHADFVRPLFNFTYWLLGLFMAPLSGASLYFNFFVVGACAGLTWLALHPPGAQAPRFVAGLAAATPMMPALIPSLALLVVPCLAFDPLAACFALLAFLAFERGRMALTALSLLAAVLTKETALPVAVALPVMFAWLQREDWRTPQFWLSMALLAGPVVVWLGLRLLAFDAVAGSVYVLQSRTGLGLRRLVLTLPRWPFWLDTLPHRSGGSAAILSGALLLANVTFLAAAAMVAWRRWRRREAPRVAEVSLLACYGFMLLVGIAPRFGVVLAVFLVVGVVRWLAEGLWAGRVALAGLVLGLAATAARTGTALPPFLETMNEYSTIGRNYPEALRALPAGSRVIALNDPVTWDSKPHWLAQVAGLDIELLKAADFACPGTSGRLESPCRVELRQAGPRRFEFTQSCGLDLCGARAPVTQPAATTLAPGIDVVLTPLPDPAAPGRDPRWRRVTLELDAGDTNLVYFDPVSRAFQVVHVP
jgi:hypothetical protein